MSYRGDGVGEGCYSLQITGSDEHPHLQNSHPSFSEREKGILGFGKRVQGGQEAPLGPESLRKRSGGKREKALGANRQKITVRQQRDVGRKIRK